MRRTPQAVLALIAAAALLAGGQAPAVADPTPSDPEPPRYSLPLSPELQAQLDAQRDKATSATITEQMRQVSTVHLSATTSTFPLDAENATIQASTELDEGVRLAADILFDWDSAKLKPQARAKLVEIIAEIPQGAAVQVNGYTDALGSESYNLTLSKKRAQAVADVIAADRPDLVLTVQGFGKADPVAPNTNDDGSDNPIGRAQNRRVEILY